MNVVFLTNVSSPYRVEFFNELGKHCDLDVWYEYRSEPTEKRDKSWEDDSAIHYRAVYDFKLSRLKKYDLVFICGFSTPKEMAAILYLKAIRKPYVMEIDGGFPDKVGFLKWCVKHILVGGATHYLSTGEAADQYLIYNGAKPERIVRYHFSSTTASQTLPEPISDTEKQQIRKELGLGDEYVLVYVGRFVQFKGVDVFLKAINRFQKNTAVYLIGGELTETYKTVIAEEKLKNVHTIRFLRKDELKKWYLAADLMIFPSRNDIWGLVVNEAMAMGLPIVSSNRSVAALEMIENGVNGWIFEMDNAQELANCVNTYGELTADQCKEMKKRCIQVAKKYTIDAMVEDHVAFIHNNGETYGKYR